MTNQPALPGVLGKIAPALNHYGYLAVAGFICLEDFGVPVPGETILIAAAVYAGAHRLNIILVVLVAVLAAVVGDNVGYGIGRYGGRRLALKFGRYVFLTPQRLDHAQEFFARHGGKVVTIARFVEGLRQANGVIAGITRMSWPRFLSFNALGAVLWVGSWSATGYFAGRHIASVYGAVHRYERYVLALVVLIVLALVARAVIRHRRGPRPADAGGSPSAVL